MLLTSLWESIQITFLVAVMMITVDFINVRAEGKLALILHTTQKWKQYLLGSFLGTLPGCLGSYAGVSLYMHGIISFGALAGLMIATSGDEAFVMLAMFPKIAIILFIVLFIIGVFSGKIIDSIVNKLNIPNCMDCEAVQIHNDEKSYKHYIKDHIWNHIVKEHVWKIFLWTFGALLLIEFSTNYLNLESLTSQYIWVVLLLSVLIGIIPDSGPHLIFVSLFAQGLIPFSILLSSSIVQDGHGMLPMLSFSVKDSISIKIFNALIGLLLGSVLLLLGL
ncbi:MAG: arsenic efflux protein [Bacteroidetes bacterium]|nr:arsenic efflux protein [Bacteroidota bacterium]